jgi:fumarate reductase flavoprotein subunit
MGKFFLYVFALTIVLCGGTALFAEDMEDPFTADRHVQYGSCSICHMDDKPVQGAWVEWSKCLECHGEYAELGERTKSFGEWNPHKSHQAEVDCTVCHKGHMKAELFCAGCHANLADNNMK